MKALFAMLGLAMPLFVLSVSAQVAVDLKLDQDQFLPGEALPATVHITNHSGRTIHLGDAGWLTFFIQTDDGSVVPKKADIPVSNTFDLENDEVAVKHLDLAPYFVLGNSGTYHITATIHIKEWSGDVTSQPQNFDIIEGAEIWSQAFGVPNSSAANQPPKVRKYSLVQANYLRDQLRLYIQVLDASDGSVVKVQALGPMISFSQPEAQLDRVSDLHVLWQTGASVFTYCVISPDGTVTEQDTYDYIGTHPRLGEDDKGNIFVMGGVRRSQPGEIPAVKPPDQLAP